MLVSGRTRVAGPVRHPAAARDRSSLRPILFGNVLTPQRSSPPPPHTHTHTLLCACRQCGGSAEDYLVAMADRSHGGEVERAAQRLLADFRNGVLGRFALERPADLAARKRREAGLQVGGRGEEGVGGAVAFSNPKETKTQGGGSCEGRGGLRDSVQGQVGGQACVVTEVWDRGCSAVTQHLLPHVDPPRAAPPAATYPQPSM